MCIGRPDWQTRPGEQTETGRPYEIRVFRELGQGGVTGRQNRNPAVYYRCETENRLQILYYEPVDETVATVVWSGAGTDLCGESRQKGQDYRRFLETDQTDTERDARFGRIYETAREGMFGESQTGIV